MHHLESDTESPGETEDCERANTNHITESPARKI
jgi:hypothetical protein